MGAKNHRTNDPRALTAQSVDAGVVAAAVLVYRGTKTSSRSLHSQIVACVAEDGGRGPSRTAVKLRASLTCTDPEPRLNPRLKLRLRATLIA